MGYTGFPRHYSTNGDVYIVIIFICSHWAVSVTKQVIRSSGVFSRIGFETSSIDAVNSTRASLYMLHLNHVS